MTNKEILNICKEIEGQQPGTTRKWDIDEKKIICDYSDNNHNVARLSLIKDNIEVGHCHLYFYNGRTRDVTDWVVGLLGDEYINIELTAIGQPQEYEESDDEYDFWDWVIRHNDSCMVCDTKKDGQLTIEICFDGDVLGDFCEAFCSEDGYIEAKLVCVGAVCVDISEVLPYTRDIKKLWKNRPAGLRKDW